MTKKKRVQIRVDATQSHAFSGVIGIKEGGKAFVTIRG